MRQKKSPTVRTRRRATEPAAAPLQPSWLSELSGPILLFVVFGLLAAWSWRKWPDLLIDFGQQLYIPWQLASGKLLHKDIIILHGPLSQHFNALWFRLFGPSLSVLIFINLAILAALAATIYLTIRRFADALTATTSCVVFLTLFGFSQYVRVGNYNYVTPYTHEVTHGMALTATMILALYHYLTRGGGTAAALAGLCLGLTLLTKVDIALPAAAVAFFGIFLAHFFAPLSATPKKPEIFLLFSMIVTPSLIFFFYFVSFLPVGQAIQAVGQGFFALSSGDIAGNTFYLRILGLDRPRENFIQMTTMFVAVVVFITAAAAADIVMRRCTTYNRVAAALLGATYFAGLYVFIDLVPWVELPRALPLTTAVALAVFLVLLIKGRRKSDSWPHLLPMFLWSLFALGLIMKIILNVYFYHYGFYLAMPATLVLVIVLVYWIPKWLRETYGSGTVFRAVALATLAIAAMYHLNWSQQLYRLKTLAIGNGGDKIFTFAPESQRAGQITALALEWIEEKTPRNATIVGLPEGIMLNYLTRRESTLPYLNFMMGELTAFGEKPIADALTARPSDYVVIVHSDTSEFGVGPFGSDPRYGKEIMERVNQHYEQAVLIGSEPFKSRNFGIKILKRKS